MRRLVGSSFLIAGTTIGAAMLALPIDTGVMGFFPAAAAFVLIWLALMITAFYFLEVSLHAPKHSNMITMAGETLGPIGKGVSTLVYVMLLYALVSSYLAGGAGALHSAANETLGWEISFPLALIGFCCVFGLFIYLGTASVDHLNRLLFLGLILTFIWMIGLSLPYVQGDKLLRMNPSSMGSGLAIAVTSFGFHIVIPTLRDYLERDEKVIKKALWIGGTLPLIFYLIWNAIVIGILPLKAISWALEEGAMPQMVLERQLGSYFIGGVASFFAFFAIITSFLGVSMSLLDFIADGLKISKGRIGRLVLCLLVFIPPMAFVLSDPRGFYKALRFGGLMVTILLGIFPPLMARAQRKKKKGGYHLFGGRALINGTLLFFLGVLAICLVELF